MAEWSHHEVFCGSDKSSEVLYHAAAQLAAIEALVNAERATIVSTVGTLRDDARAICERGLDAVYAFELQVREATTAQEAASKALKRGNVAREAAMSDERKADALKDVLKQNQARAKAQAALEKANGDIADAEAALETSKADLARLATEAQPVALQAATALACVPVVDLLVSSSTRHRARRAATPCELRASRRRGGATHRPAVPSARGGGGARRSHPPPTPSTPRGFPPPPPPRAACAPCD